jgi:hypothetical protein
VSSRREAVFLFVDEDPPQVVIYPDLEWASASLESLDVASLREEGFTETGQVVLISESEDLFANFQLTDAFRLDSLRSLLRDLNGPTQLAEDPAAYAQEWLRLDALDARRPPFVPTRLWDWYRGHVPSGPWMRDGDSEGDR